MNIADCIYYHHHWCWLTRIRYIFFWVCLWCSLYSIFCFRNIQSGADMTRPIFFKILTIAYDLAYLWGVMHDDVIKWTHFPRYWPFVRGIPLSPVNSPHKGQWRGALMFFFHLRSNKRLSKQWWGGDCRRYRAHYDVTVMGFVLCNVWYMLYLMYRIWPRYNSAQLYRAVCVTLFSYCITQMHYTCCPNLAII